MKEIKDLVLITDEMTEVKQYDRSRKGWNKDRNSRYRKKSVTDYRSRREGGRINNFTKTTCI